MSIPDRQQAMLMNGPGAPLEKVERPVDEPGPGQVLVKVNATSLNFHDNVNLMGLAGALAACADERRRRRGGRGRSGFRWTASRRPRHGSVSSELA